MVEVVFLRMDGLEVPLYVWLLEVALCKAALNCCVWIVVAKRKA